MDYREEEALSSLQRMKSFLTIKKAAVQYRSPYSLFRRNIDPSVFHRHVNSSTYACFLTQISSSDMPSQDIPNGQLDQTPSIQWRDRAGFSPASILAL
jgi:hypothetical protein